MKTLTERLLDWNNEKFDEIDATKDKHPNLKAAGTGAVKGYIDAAVIMYIPALILVYYWKHKATKK